MHNASPTTTECDPVTAAGKTPTTTGADPGTTAGKTPTTTDGDPGTTVGKTPTATNPDPLTTAGKTLSLRTSTDSWVQITLCVIVVGLLLVVAAVPNSVSNAPPVLEQPAYGLRLALADMRAAIAAYQLDHLAWPGCAPGSADSGCAAVSEEWFVRQLTQPTGLRGQSIDPRSGEIAPRLGPYLPFSLPANPVNGLSTVRVLAADQPWPDWADGSTGWIYQPASGEIRANAAGAVIEAGVRYYQL